MYIIFVLGKRIML